LVLSRIAAMEAAKKKAEEAAKKKAEEDAATFALERKKAVDDLNHQLPIFLNKEKHEKETNALLDAYNLRSKELAEWIARRDEGMRGHVTHKTFGDTTDEVQDKIDHLRDDVDAKETEKLDLETLNNAINTRMKLENRPRPVHEVPMEKLNSLWNQAVVTEQGYKKCKDSFFLIIQGRRLNHHHSGMPSAA